MTLGRPRLHHRVLGSTNALARELAAAGAPHGTLVTAAQQTAGRGRQGRSWVAPAGRALLASVLLREPPELLPLRAGLAAADVCGPGAAVKWPNDVLLHERKVAGVLVEGRPQEGWAVLGIGINVAVRAADLPQELRARAGGLSLEPADVEPVLERLLRALGQRLDQDGGTVLAALRERDALRGQLVEWGEGRGTATGIDDAGRLLVRAAGRTVVLTAGEVHLRG